jgi:hypothetical protein
MYMGAAVLQSSLDVAMGYPVIHMSILAGNGGGLYLKIAMMVCSYLMPFSDAYTGSQHG